MFDVGDTIENCGIHYTVEGVNGNHVNISSLGGVNMGSYIATMFTLVKGKKELGITLFFRKQEKTNEAFS